MLDGGTCVFECRGDDVEALLCLLGDVAVICADGAGAGDVDVVADADSAGETNDGLIRGCAGDVGAGHTENSTGSKNLCADQCRLRSVSMNCALRTSIADMSGIIGGTENLD